MFLSEPFGYMTYAVILCRNFKCLYSLQRHCSSPTTPEGEGCGKRGGEGERRGMEVAWFVPRQTLSRNKADVERLYEIQ